MIIQFFTVIGINDMINRLIQRKLYEKEKDAHKKIFLIILFLHLKTTLCRIYFEASSSE